MFRYVVPVLTTLMAFGCSGVPHHEEGVDDRLTSLKERWPEAEAIYERTSVDWNRESAVVHGQLVRMHDDCIAVRLNFDSPPLPVLPAVMLLEHGSTMRGEWLALERYQGLILGAHMFNPDLLEIGDTALSWK